MKALRNKVVLLTGAAGGLGSSLARALLAEDAHLILTDLDQAALRELQASLREEYPGAVTAGIAADLSRESECNRLARAVEGLAPKVDILINNAGIGHVGDFLDIPAERFETMMQVNTLAPMRLTRLFLPGMRERGSGRVVFISSLAGVVGLSNLAAYSASKFAVHGFVEAMRGDLESQGIGVTGVYPSFTNTNFLNSPRFGVNPDVRVPSFLLDDPDVVARNIVRGIRRNRARVLPSFRARLTWMMNRVSPELVRRAAVFLRRRLLGEKRGTPSERIEFRENYRES